MRPIAQAADIRKNQAPNPRNITQVKTVIYKAFQTQDIKPMVGGGGGVRKTPLGWLKKNHFLYSRQTEVCTKLLSLVKRF